jgi:putative phosphoesterase
MVCCGDLCSPFVIDELASRFPRLIHIVFGNNDADLFRITSKLQKYSNVRLHGEFCEITFERRSFAVNHFDYIARPIAQSGRYDVVCFGHNHELEITRYGTTLALNPGSILGAKFSKGRQDTDSTFLIYDTASGEAQSYRVDLAAGCSVAMG